MSSLDAWKESNTFEVTLKSGVRVKGRYRSMEHIITSGNFNYSVLRDLDTATDAEATPEQIAEGVRFKRTSVQYCLLEVEGEDVFPLSDDDYGQIPEDDIDEFYSYASRTVAVPLAVP